MNTTSSFSKLSARLREVFHWGERSRGSYRPSSYREADEFESLALDLFALQFDHNESYWRFCQGRNLTPASIKRWSQIPSVPTAAFKELELTCLPNEERTTVFYSSGTTGQARSRHFHSAESLGIYEASLLAWFESCVTGSAGVPPASSPSVPLGVRVATGSGTLPELATGTAGLPGKKLRLLSLTPSPAEAPHSSLAYMFETLRREFGAEGSGFLGSVNGHRDWTLDVEAAAEQIKQVCAASEPVMLMGTAFSFVHLLDYLDQTDLRLSLPPGSKLLETGGYKGKSRTLPKSELHSLMSQRLGISASHIVCEYGMSELSSQAYDIEVSPNPRSWAGESPKAQPRIFRFPPWAAVQIVSAETGIEVGEGETGLVRVFDLANVYSVMAIQTEDLAVNRGDGFEILGRANLSEPRGCSLMAV